MPKSRGLGGQGQPAAGDGLQQAKQGSRRERLGRSSPIAAPEVIECGFLQQTLRFSQLHRVVVLNRRARRVIRCGGNLSSGRKRENRDCLRPASRSPRRGNLPAQAPRHGRIVRSERPDRPIRPIPPEATNRRLAVPGLEIQLWGVSCTGVREDACPWAGCRNTST